MGRQRYSSRYYQNESNTKWIIAVVVIVALFIAVLAVAFLMFRDEIGPLPLIGGEEESGNLTEVIAPTPTSQPIPTNAPVVATQPPSANTAIPTPTEVPTPTYLPTVTPTPAHAPPTWIDEFEGVWLLPWGLQL